MLDARQNDLLRGLTPPELEAVTPLFQRRRFRAGEAILRWGESGDCLYVIESGLVCVLLPSRGGEETVLAQLGPGQIFGEMAILTGQPRSAEVRALVETAVATLSVQDFFRVAGRSPTLLLNIGRVLAGRLGHMTRANTQRERRAVISLVGPVPLLIGSVLATNLVASLALVSGRRAMLLDAPPPRAAALPGREWAPGLEEIRGGVETLAHMAQLPVGPLTIHVVNLPEEQPSAEPSAVHVGRVLSQLRRVSEFVVLNLTGPSAALVDSVVPLTSRTLVVAPTSALRSPDLARLVQRCRDIAPTGSTMGAMILAGDGEPPQSVKARAQAALGVTDCAVLPGQADLLREVALARPPLTIHAPRSAVSKSLGLVAREVAGLRVGVALGSGAAKGVAHVGVVAALDRLGVPIDVVTGTSIGALVGAGVAMGMDMHQIVETMDRLVDLWGEALKPTLPRFALISPKGLDRIVHGLAGDVRFEELPIAFGAVATDLASGRPVYMRRGSVAQAVRASISIPLIFPPLFVGDYVLTDGFVTNPVPTEFARLLGADVILASSLAGPLEESDTSPIDYTEPDESSSSRRGAAPNILATYLRCAEIMMMGRGERDSLSADLTLRPRLPSMSWKEFQKGGAPMQAGERAVEDELASLRELLPWLRVAL